MNRDVTTPRPLDEVAKNSPLTSSTIFPGYLFHTANTEVTVHERRIPGSQRISRNEPLFDAMLAALLLAARFSAARALPDARKLAKGRNKVRRREEDE